MASVNKILTKAYVDFALKKFGKFNGGRLLDLGCGTCPFYALYCQLPLTPIKADFTKRTTDIDLMCDGQFLPFESNSFNVVILSEVIEHIPNPALAFREISRVLTPGGIMIITWPYNYMVHEAPFDYYRMSFFALENLTKLNSLKILHASYRGGFFVVVLVLLLHFIKGIARAFSKIPLVGRIVTPLTSFAINLVETAIGKFRLKYIMRSWENQILTGLKYTGFKGQLNGWTLGFLAVVQK